MIIHLPILHTTLCLKWGRGLYSNIRSVSTIYAPTNVDAVKSHDDLAVAIRRNSSNVGHAPQESYEVCWYPTEEWQRNNVQLTVVTGDKGRLGTHMCVYVFRG